MGMLLPTKAENLKVNIKDNKLMLTGMATTNQKIGKFELNSKHDWSKNVEIPNWVDIESIKVKLNETKDKISITGSRNKDKELPSKEVSTKENDSIIQIEEGEEIDIELEELLQAAEEKKLKRNANEEK